MVSIPRRGPALEDVGAFVGDGATERRILIRRLGERLIGHAPVGEQIQRCAEERVPRMVVTHCGSWIVKGDERTTGPRLRRLGREMGVDAAFAHDGDELALR